jgi:hypothetical protein
MTERAPSAKELEDLEEAMNSEARAINIRLREGEYQHSLAKAIAAFGLKLHFPDVKELVRKLFGEKRTEDSQFLSKIQTILKKMEKSGIVKILPKEKPWELQRYALCSFKFLDVEKNQIVLATKAEVENTRGLIHSQSSKANEAVARPKRTTNINAGILLLIFVTVVSYSAIIWTLTLPAVDLVVFASASCAAIACSMLLGILISRRK